jgi:hypothetical protein
MFEEALKLDPAERDASGVRADMLPMIWATVTAAQAATIDASITEAVAVANLRYRTQWLSGLSDAEVAKLIDDALAEEARLGRP